jgi:hypothetical protein
MRQFISSCPVNAVQCIGMVKGDDAEEKQGCIRLFWGYAIRCVQLSQYAERYP